MTKQQEFAQLEYKIQTAQQDVLSLEIRLSAIERELDVYLLFEVQLIENISILKRKRIIAMAQEYKKAKEELATVRRKIVIARDERLNYQKALKHARSVLQRCQHQYDITVSRYENTVVHGTFGRKNGQR